MPRRQLFGVAQIGNAAERVISRCEMGRLNFNGKSREGLIKLLFSAAGVKGQSAGLPLFTQRTYWLAVIADFNSSGIADL